MGDGGGGAAIDAAVDGTAVFLARRFPSATDAQEGPKGVVGGGDFGGDFETETATPETLETLS